MTSAQVRALVEHRPWLIVTVGTTETHGPHLPLGCDTLILERLADDLSARFRIPCAPTIEFGVNTASARVFPGGAGLTRKTLHRMMNELIQCWEMWANIREFVILTAQGYEPHQEALSTIRVADARVQVVDIFALDLGDLVEESIGPLHGGEIDSSLLLYVAPELARMSEAQDFLLPPTLLARYKRGSRRALPSQEPGYAGFVGSPSRASREKGERVYNFILERIASRCFPFTSE